MRIGDGGVELRPLTEGDADELFQTVDRNRGRLRRWLAWVDRTRSVEDTRTWIRTTTEEIFVIRDREGRLAGCVGFEPDINDQARIGYWLDRNAEGKGLMTAAVRRLLAFCFAEKGFQRAEICCAVGNRRSRAIPERLGFVQEGVRRKAESCPTATSTWLFTGNSPRSGTKPGRVDL